MSHRRTHNNSTSSNSLQNLVNRTDSDASSFSQSSITTTGSSSSNYSHIPGAVANLCSATLGAGILALPYALLEAGIVCGGILLVCSAWSTSSSIQILVQACDEYKLTTYESVVEHILGKRARKIVEVSILIFCLGCAIGYVIAVGDIIERVVFLTPDQKRVAMAIVWLCAMLPLSCLRRMQSLQCASTVGIASIATLLVAATAHLINPKDESYIFLSSSSSLKTFLGPHEVGWLAVLRACPIVFFAFSCQVNVCQIYDELPGRRGEEKARMMKWVTWLAVGLCGLLYTSISMVALMDFGEDVQPNMLSCYTLTNKENLLHVAFLAMALAIVMAFPLNVFPARVSIIQMLGTITLCGSAAVSIPSEDEECQQLIEDSSEDPLRSQLLTVEDCPLTNNDNDDNTDIEGEEEFNLVQHVFVTLLLAGTALGLALVIPDISVVFGLLGGTTSSLLGFVIPGLMGLRMNPSDINAWILVVAGSLIGVLTTLVTLYTTIHEML